MGSVALYIENNGEKLPKSSLSALAAALEIKQAHGHEKVIGVLIGGTGTSAAANEAAQYGLDEVLYVQSSALEQYLALQYAETLKLAVDAVQPAVIVAASTSRGKDFLPRIAQLFDAGQASDCTAILPGGKYRRPMYAGNVLADVEITTAVQVVTIRPSAFGAASKAGTCAVRELAVHVLEEPRMKFVRFDQVKNERPELGEAEIVVSGGRALKSAETFQQHILPLADALGAAVGASRAAVDSGYAPNDWQVGQTGKVVAPKLYIAVGISGAIQHLAGMKDSKTIVAINKDSEAPIFEVADYGLVADLFEVVPQLTEAVKKARGQ
ncbi:MAG: electron transfer flavoprotein subunit alpha/FixB family protein [Deltaproteobacteria bacterium]|nr:electron transfer flavoprotein subunit alpha/FixB family protein [Deltaproteobacteria bacterium]